MVAERSDTTGTVIVREGGFDFWPVVVAAVVVVIDQVTKAMAISASARPRT